MKSLRSLHKTILVGCLLFTVAVPATSAFEGITISGYLSTKGTYGANDDATGQQQDYANGYATDSVNFNNHGSHVGIQFDASVSKKIDTTVILQAHGGKDNFALDVEWGYADYNFDDHSKLRLGRYKAPFYMISEYQEVGYAYPWVSPPQEVYGTNPIEAVNGLDYVFQTSTAGGMDVLFEVYAGNGSYEAVIQPNVADLSTSDPYNKGDIVDFDTKNMIGFNATLGTDAVKFRLGYMSTKVDAPSFGMNNASGSFGGVGLIVDWRNFLSYVEFVDRDTEDTTTMQMAFPDQRAGYATVGYRFGDFLPYLTYAKLDRGKTLSSMALKQWSLTLGARYEVADGAALKFEATRATPESIDGSQPKYGLFDGPLQSDNGLILAASFDLIF